MSEQLGRGARVDGEKSRGDPLPDPVELAGGELLSR